MLGVGIHLIEGEPVKRKSLIDPRSDHISFTADDLQAVEAILTSVGITYTKQFVVEEDVVLEQVGRVGLLV
jgi:hypothetical protein